MTRWILLSMLAATLTGCERQVSINEPIGDLVAASDSSGVDPSANPSANPGADQGSPVVLTPDAAPVINDSSSVNSDNSTPVSPATLVDDPNSNQNSDSVDASGESDATDATPSVTELAVRLAEPTQLTDTAGAGVLTPVLVGSDGNVIAMECCDASGSYNAIVPLNRQQQWVGTIQWRAPFGIEPVTVFQADVVVEPGSDGVVDITPVDYNLNLDNDGDGVNNLTELVLGTSPLNATDVSADFRSATVRIPRVTANQVPTIDGDAGEYVPGTTRMSGEWERAVHVDVAGNRLSIGNSMFNLAGTSAAENHHWMALHDGTWLYLLIIIDDAGLHHFDSQEILKPWRDDSLELFFDGDNSMQPEYDGVDDFSMHVVLLDTLEGGVNSSTNADPKLYPSVNSVPLPAGVVFTTGPLKGPAAPQGFASDGVRQDVYEIAIRITDLNIELARTFGFEVQFDDDDDGGDRDSKWGWDHPAGTTSDNDFSWRDPRFMGRAVLLP